MFSKCCVIKSGIKICIISGCLFKDWLKLKCVSSWTCGQVFLGRNILYVCGPLLHYNYFWHRVSRACLESWVVYVTGQSGLPNSERQTLPNVSTGRWLRRGRSGGRQIWKSSWSIRFNTNPCPRGTSINLYSPNHANAYLSNSLDLILAFASYSPKSDISRK